jgi:alpha,alpha-trehalase
MRFFLLLILLSQSAFSFQESSDLKLLYKKFDRDHDKKITADDKISSAEVFANDKIKAKGLYQISIAAQELALSGKVDENVLHENPVERISRIIRDLYWDGLTRHIDASTILKVASDSKIKSKELYLYVPSEDTVAFDHYKKSKINVIKLPENIPEGFVTKLGTKQGLLSLAMKDGKGVPYVVPGGRFNEMYGWDSYFHVLGTINDGRTDLARGMVDNFVYEINHYGKILNANRTYYLTRSQPPFLTSMIRAVYEVLPKNAETEKWLEHSIKAAIKEYETVWMGKDRLTDTGLSRYAGFDNGIPPEVEPGHFDHVLIPVAKKYKLSLVELKRRFNAGKLKDAELIEFFHQDRAVRESGHDTTYRWRVGDEDHASDFVTVDLNSLLYKFEMDLSELIHDKELARKYKIAASKRKELIRKYLWNEDKKLFFDYNWKTKAQSDYISATTFYPLWAGDILKAEEAKELVKNALRELESNGGLSATARSSLDKVQGKNEERQWDYPNGWAPHQMIAWQGLENYQFEKDKNRLIYKWLYMITKNAMDYNGTIPEKYDVVSRSHKVFAEYGNVGTKFSYITKEGFGWMNASYQIGLKKLSSEDKEKLFKLKDPIHE